MVALRTLNRGALEHVKDRGDHFIAIQVLGVSAIELTLSDFLVAHIVPGTGGQETKAYNPIRFAGKEHISCYLLLNKL